jgi:hypothetical protein
MRGRRGWEREGGREEREREDVSVDTIWSLFGIHLSTRPREITNLNIFFLSSQQMHHSESKLLAQSMSMGSTSHLRQRRGGKTLIKNCKLFTEYTSPASPFLSSLWKNLNCYSAAEQRKCWAVLQDQSQSQTVAKLSCWRQWTVGQWRGGRRRGGRQREGGREKRWEPEKYGQEQELDQLSPL